jgi:hypothetical protein
MTNVIQAIRAQVWVGIGWRAGDHPIPMWVMYHVSSGPLVPNEASVETIFRARNAGNYSKGLPSPSSMIWYNVWVGIALLVTTKMRETRKPRSPARRNEGTWVGTAPLIAMKMCGTRKPPLGAIKIRVKKHETRMPRLAMRKITTPRGCQFDHLTEHCPSNTPYSLCTFR